jgi:thiol-disulfide isomerase/thioredoxin
MKKIISIVSTLLLVVITHLASAQTVAQNFTSTSCSGPPYELFNHLDQEKVVIIEFFMLNCTSCITAGNKLNPLYNTLSQQYPGRVEFWQMAFNNTYNCVDLSNWQNSHGYNSVMFDSGAAQVAYYGGFGMPTIAVVAGSTHQVLFKRVGFQNNDTTLIGTAVRGFLNTTTGIQYVNEFTKINLYPNPAQTEVNIQVISEQKNVSFMVTDLTGKRMQLEPPVLSGESTYKINTSGFSAGVYILQMISNVQPVSTRFTITK